MSLQSRFVHFVLKIGNLKENIEFFRDKLRMKVYRHEVFTEGCAAHCNGPYDNRWSKTMIGYGPESENFVLELTYNYTVDRYRLGNDYQHIKIELLPDTFREVAGSCDQEELKMVSPDGYTFIVVKNSAIPKNLFSEVCLSTSNLELATHHWRNLLQMEGVSETPTESVQRYKEPEGQTHLRFRQIEGTVDHGTAYGRMAFSLPLEVLDNIQEIQATLKLNMLQPLVKLETPGKATVAVVIVADPDGHEICYVGAEGFAELSQEDPRANERLELAMAHDKSKEWLESKGMSKKEAEK